MIACYPGSFDPITNGHVDIIGRAAEIFDEVIVLIMHNPRKHCEFSEEERKDMIEQCIRKYSWNYKVRVIIGSGLTVNVASQIGAGVIIRGIRAVSDYEYELVQATANMMLDNKIETMLMIARPEYSFLSSSAVKEIAVNNGDISRLVPVEILDTLMKRLKPEDESFNGSQG